MEREWLMRDEQPYLRPASGSNLWPSGVLAIVLIAAMGGYYYFYLREQPAQPAPAVNVRPPESAPAPQASAPPAIRNPLEAAPPDAAAGLPSLDNSDSMMRRSLAGLIGGKPFAELFIPEQLIRRIVATIDNLPRPTVPRRMMPLNPVPGRLVIAGTEDAATLAPANSARYAPYVRVFESVDAQAVVQGYVRAYPLFQRAYEELGYPGQYFNDRLMDAIDDMLASPGIDGPIKLAQSKVLYEFADSDLESRSAGQKIMIRMGTENASRVKAKLRTIRGEILAASKRP
jgi:hypothetical protein